VLTQEDEEVLWWLLQRHAAAGATAGMPAGGDEDAEGCLGAGASPGAAQELCLNYDDFTQAGLRACSGIFAQQCAAAWWGCSPPVCVSPTGADTASGCCRLLLLAVQVAAECREAIGPVADLYFQASGAACCKQECTHACCLLHGCPRCHL
jgi:hypothetical protein